MKKLLSIVIAMVLAMSFFTGCVKGDKEQNDVQPTPTPSPSPEVITEDDEEDPNYATVLAMWGDMDGYWVNDDGEYLQFKLDESGKAEMYAYKEDGSLDGKLKASAVMASNKMSYYMAFDGANKGLFIELEGYGDGYVKISEESADSDYEVYVYVGENLDNLSEAIDTAEKLEKE